MVSPLSLIALVFGALCHCAPLSTPTVVPTPAPAAVSIPAHTAVRDYAQDTVPTLSDTPKLATVADFTPLVSLPSRIVPPAPKTFTFNETIAGQEASLIDLINRERSAVGEQMLSADDLLIQVARSHSLDMCVRDYFDHYAPSPGPVTPMDRYIAARQSRPNYAMVGENIYYRSATDSESDYAAEAHDAFMHSPGHRANILTAQYTKVGVGIYKDPRTGEFWVTEMFCTETAPR